MRGSASDDNENEEGTEKYYDVKDCSDDLCSNHLLNDHDHYIYIIDNDKNY